MCCVDAAACDEGLLRHGEADGGRAGVSRDIQHGASLCMQLESMRAAISRSPWFELAFKHADELTREDKAEILARAFQVNHERLRRGGRDSWNCLTGLVPRAARRP